MNYYRLSVTDTLSEIKSSKEGLSSSEAQERLQTYGANKLAEGKKTTAVQILLGQFTDFLIWVLIIAAVVSFFIGETVDSIAIILIVILNGILGFVQEYRAEKSIEALKKMQTPEANIIRDRKEQRIPCEEIVPGDILILREGDKISADARIIEAVRLEVDESLLTGESLPVKKNIEKIDQDVVLGDQHNMVFSGCAITIGRAQAVVTATGMQTEMGEIAKAVQEVEAENTPLQKSLGKLGKFLGIICLAVAGIGFAIGAIDGQDPLEMFMIAVSLAVAAIPEGLPIVVTIALALGTRRMLKHQALVRKLPVVEILGGTEVICTDKTGTLTKNKMTVVEIAVVDSKDKQNQVIKRLKISDLSEKKQNNQIAERAMSDLMTTAVLCNDAAIDQGDPTERALLQIASELGSDPAALIKAHQRSDEIPFTSASKYMVTLNGNDTQKTAFMKGATEVVLGFCKSVRIGNEIRELTDQLRQDILAEVSAMSEDAYRVLGFASRPVPEKTKLDELNEYIFLGMVGMIDPPREEVKDAMLTCKQAGVRVVMITGDHQLTAQAIAKQIGMENSDRSLTGMEIEQIDENKFLKTVEEVSIFARVSPKHKQRILAALQSSGHTVAMTGDGVNDAPALKKADIGLAVGSGTDLAREVSDMVLLDDNFATISQAIEEGRNIFSNIKKFVRYLIAANFGEILLIFLSILMRVPVPLIPIQILWLNLATDSLPALALSVDVDDPNSMKKKPYKAEQEILKGIISFSIVVGVLAFISTFGVYFYEYSILGHSIERARTMAFTAIVLYEFFIVFSCRSEKSAFELGIFSNLYLWGSIGLGLLLQVFVIYVPAAQQVFKTVALNFVDWLFVLAAAASGFVVIELGRAIINLRRKKVD